MDALAQKWVTDLETLFFKLDRAAQRRQLRNTLETTADLIARNNALRMTVARLETELREQPTAYGGF